MDQFIEQVASGLATGSVYAILALAIVLIYRSTSIVNFAQGEMAMFGTFIAWSFLTRMDFWPAFVLALLVSAFIGAALERIVLRPVEEAPVLNAVIVTLGLFLVFNSLALWEWGGIPKPFPSPGIFEGAPLSLGPATVSRLKVGIFCTAALLMLLMYVFFNYTKVGLAMRATAQNRTAARLVGVNTGGMLTLAWALSAAIGGAAGMLIAPIIFLSPTMMFSTLIFAFTGAVLGGLDSAPGAIVGGLLVGVIQNLAGTYIASDIDITIAFAVIVAVLLVRPTGLFGQQQLRRV